MDITNSGGRERSQSRSEGIAKGFPSALPFRSKYIVVFCRAHTVVLSHFCDIILRGLALQMQAEYGVAFAVFDLGCWYSGFV